ncbi:unnamed protein product [Brachionus calyciflorus]|uniref:CS domain-containing protein n=1 Tax=Brachionus calyciflorus TaxID=104777 RepID=A0A813M185_9BILA|nr:unnamed protein product [Brachionus calyciflorus]
MEPIRPNYSFEENDKNVTFVLIIDDLKVKRKLSRKFQKYPINARVINQSFEEQSINFTIKSLNNSIVYQFLIKRLPTQIIVEKTKIKYDNNKIELILTKAETETWKPYVEYDFETINLIK